MNPLTYLLEKYPEKPWKWNCISRNPNITMKMIEKYPNKPLGLAEDICESKSHYGND